MSKRLRNAVILVGILIVLSFAGLILWPLWPYLGSPGVDQQIRELKRQGKPVSAKDLVPPKIPDSENAAILYQKAFDAVPLSKRELITVADALKHSSDQKALSDWRRVKPLIVKCDAALAIAAQAVKLPKCAFPVKWEQGYKAELPHLAKLRELGRLFAARALINARDGRVASAMRDIETGFALSQAVHREPSLISMLVQVALVSIAGAAFGDCLAYCRVEETKARSLYDQLGRVDLKASHIRALEGERAQLLTMCETLRRGDLGEALGLQGAETAGGAPTVFSRIFGAANQWWVLKMMGENIRNSRLSYRELVTRRIPEPDRNLPKYAILAAIGSPLVRDTARARDRGIALVSGTRVALALEAYYDRFRAYPQMIEELRTKLDWRLDKDPFSGNDFVYRKLPRGYLLYSVGPNLKDDGGKHFDEKKRTTDAKDRPTIGHLKYPGDIVWRIER